MKGRRYTEEQVTRFLKSHEAGIRIGDLVREHGISEQSFYRWKSNNGGMEVNEAKRLRELEQENRRWKRLLAEAELHKAMVKDVLGECGEAPSRKRFVGYIRRTYNVGQRRACKVILVNRKAVR